MSHDLVPLIIRLRDLELVESISQLQPFQVVLLDRGRRDSEVVKPLPEFYSLGFQRVETTANN